MDFFAMISPCRFKISVVCGPYIKFLPLTKNWGEGGAADARRVQAV